MAKLHHAVKLKQIGVRWVPGGGMSIGGATSAAPMIEDKDGNVSRMTRQRALQQATAGNWLIRENPLSLLKAKYLKA